MLSHRALNDPTALLLAEALATAKETARNNGIDLSAHQVQIEQRVTDRNALQFPKELLV